MRVRKKPVEVEAIQLLPFNYDDIVAWAGDNIEIKHLFNTVGVVVCEAMINTIKGKMHAIEGDWIIKGVNGEFYSCTDDIFRKTYDIIDDNVTTNNSEITW